MDSLSKTIWGYCIGTNTRVVGVNGLHQDFSTDECGYHVFRFVNYLYEFALPKDPKTSWNRLLEKHINDTHLRINVILYNKSLVKSVAQPILLANDELVRRFCEVGKRLVKDKANRIQVHDEYKLTEKQWSTKADEYVNSFESIGHKKISESGLTLTTTVSIVMDERRNGRGKIKTTTKRKKETFSAKKTSFDSPNEKNFNPITGQHYVTSFDQHFTEMYKKTQTSVSREILKNLFPTQVSNRLNPLLNNIQFSGMIDDPHYLNTILVQLPGDVNSMTTIGSYLKSLGVTLDAEDPFTYQLVILLRTYFENHPDKKTAEQMFSKIQKNSMKLWKNVK